MSLGFFSGLRNTRNGWLVKSDAPLDPIDLGFFLGIEKHKKWVARLLLLLIPIRRARYAPKNHVAKEASPSLM